MPHHTIKKVTLPAVATRAAHEFDDEKFDFSPDGEPNPTPGNPPMDDLPEGARVPGEIPPEGVLPEAALTRMFDTAMEKPESHGVPWWLDDLDM